MEVVGAVVGIEDVGAEVDVVSVGRPVGTFVGLTVRVVADGVGAALGLPVGPEVYGTHAASGSRGIVGVSARFLSSIRCASPARRRYQSEGNLRPPSASRASQPPSGRGRSFASAETLKIAVPSSTSSNCAIQMEVMFGLATYLNA
jgi:hypothetical protein